MGTVGWLTFDPVARKFSLDIAPEALPYILKYVTKGVVDLVKNRHRCPRRGRADGGEVR